MAQIIKNKTFNFVGVSHYYMVIDEKLTYVEIVKRIVSLQSGTAHYIVKLPDGSEKRVENFDGVESQFYRSEQDFENKAFVSQTDDFGTMHILDKLSICVNNCVDENGEHAVSPYCWVMADGGPVKRDVVLNEIDVTKQYDIMAIPVKDSTLYQLPDEYWKSHQETLLWNDYEVKEADGSVHTVKGKLKRLAITDKQQGLVQKVIDAFKEARDGGVRFAYLSDYDTLSAYNCEDVQNIEVDYCGKEDNDCDLNLCDRDFNQDEFRTGIVLYDVYVGCDSNAAIKFNEGDSSN